MHVRATREQKCDVPEVNGKPAPINMEWALLDGVFNLTNSTAYLDTGQVNVSWTGCIDDMPPCSGLGSFSRIMDRDTTETLTVVANDVCTG